MKFIKQFILEEPLALRTLLTSAEAASILSVSPSTLYQMTKDGKLPCTRIGRLVRYDPEILNRYIAGNSEFRVSRLRRAI